MPLTEKIDRLRRNHYFRLSIVLVTLLLLGGAVAMGMFFGKEFFFTENPLFTLRKTQVNSEGIWKERPEEVTEVLSLVPGETNIFGLDLRESRAKIREKLPSIETVEISRVLPDTLVFDIVERIPTAILHFNDAKFTAVVEKYGMDKATDYFRNKATYVVDGKGVLMLKDQCVNLSSSLPLITGARFDEDKVKLGDSFEEVASALALVKTLADDYPALPYRSIDLSGKDEMCLNLPGLDGNNVKVRLNRDDFSTALARLKPILMDIKKRGTVCEAIDFTFNEQGVAKSPAPDLSGLDPFKGQLAPGMTPRPFGPPPTAISTFAPVVSPPSPVVKAEVRPVVEPPRPTPVDQPDTAEPAPRPSSRVVLVAPAPSTPQPPPQPVVAAPVLAKPVVSRPSPQASRVQASGVSKPTPRQAPAPSRAVAAKPASPSRSSGARASVKEPTASHGAKVTSRASAKAVDEADGKGKNAFSMPQLPDAPKPIFSVKGKSSGASKSSRRGR